MILHGFRLSSASYRVRIALNLKSIVYKEVSYTLRKGEQYSPEYLRRNPQGLVPSLELDDGNVITQSMAICEYLDEVHPEKKLMPGSILERTRVRELALQIACDLHPLNNLRVLLYLENTMKCDQEKIDNWYKHWVYTEFESLEKRLSNSGEAGGFCHGNTPTLADVFLVPQVFNARRFDCDLSPFENVVRISSNCQNLDAFRSASPDSN